MSQARLPLAVLHRAEINRQDKYDRVTHGEYVEQKSGPTPGHGATLNLDHLQATWTTTQRT